MIKKRNYSEKKNRKRNKRYKKANNSLSRFLTGIFAVMIIMACSFGFGSFFSSAHDNTSSDKAEFKYYKSIQIEKGDSLWSIAEEYMGTEFDSVSDYIDELIQINQLSTDDMNNLQEGDYLLVAYFDTEYVE